MKAAIYCRLSKNPETDGNLEQQEARGREVATRRGWELAAVYTDSGRSAWREDAERPAFARLLAAVQAGEVDVVIARQMDRLTRNYTDWGALHRHGVRFTDWSGAEYDAFRCGIDVAKANAESDTLSKRTIASEERRVEAGKPPRGGRRHYGYDRQHEVIPEEAEILHEMATRWLDGQPLRALARELNERGLRHTSGGEWNHRSLKKCLQSPRLAGLRTHRGELVGGSWPAIFAEDLHVRLCTADAGAASRRATSRWLLTGLIFCGRCDTRLNGKMQTKGQRRYACLSCQRNGIAAEPVEAELWDEALGRAWHRERYEEGRVAARLAMTDAALSEARATLTELDGDYYQRRLIPRATYLTQSGALRERVARLEDERRSLRENAARLAHYWTNLRALADEYEQAPPERRRAVLEGTIERVVLAPTDKRTGDRVRLDRLSVVWRG